MADRDLSAGDAGALRAGYERLRSAVLAGSASGWRLGHGVLSARGMTAWLTEFAEVTPATAAGGGSTSAAVPPVSAGLEVAGDLPVPLPNADQVVAVLTQMVLPLAA